MAVKHGRLEAQYYFSANQASTWNNGGGNVVVTITAGSYYLAELVTAINTALGGSQTVAISDGEGVASSITGKATITSSGTVTVTWTDTGVRNALGFTGNLAAAASPQTGSNACPGVWLPCNPGKFTRHGDFDAGTLSTQFRQTVGPGASGVASVYSVGGGTAYSREWNGILWDGVPATRVRPQYNSSGTQTSTTNETLEEFLGNTQYGTGTYANIFTVGSQVRLYWNADDDTKYATGRFLWPERFDPDTFQPGYTAFYKINMPRLVRTT